MTGYVFWCTPCGHSHAGECPPKKVERRLPDIDFDPRLGTLWKIKYTDGSTLASTFMVVKIDGDVIWVQRGRDGAMYDYTIEAWVSGRSAGWSFVPA